MPFRLQNLHAENFNDVLRMLPTAYLILTGNTCRALQNAYNSTRAALGYTVANDGLRTAYILETVFGVPPESVSLVMRHVVLGEGQWVLWGEDRDLYTFAVLADFWTMCGRESSSEEPILETYPSSMLSDPTSIAWDRGNLWQCYGGFAACADEVQAILAARDKLPAKVDAHSSACGRCGATETLQSLFEVLFTADLPAGCNLCTPCLRATFLTRHLFFMRYGGYCGEKAKHNSYEIPAHYIGTSGTRIGIFFSGGPRHTAFGLEFWAKPTLLGSKGLWATEDEVAKGISEHMCAPPNAWNIVKEVCLYDETSPSWHPQYRRCGRSARRLQLLF